MIHAGIPRIATAMTDSKTKKFNTELTDYSTRHKEDSGPYAADLDIDAIIVGAGFGMTEPPIFKYLT